MLAVRFDRSTARPCMPHFFLLKQIQSFRKRTNFNLPLRHPSYYHSARTWLDINRRKNRTSYLPPPSVPPTPMNPITKMSSLTAALRSQDYRSQAETLNVCLGRPASHPTLNTTDFAPLTYGRFCAGRVWRVFEPCPRW